MHSQICKHSIKATETSHQYPYDAERHQLIIDAILKCVQNLRKKVFHYTRITDNI